MVIVASERNMLKRKMVESMCIESKARRLCNTGQSIDIPLVWNLCSEGIEMQLAFLD